MGKVCVKCGYERKPEDDAPDYACPKCGAVYTKVEAYLKRQKTQAFNNREKRQSQREITNTIRRISQAMSAQRPIAWVGILGLIFIAAIILLIIFSSLHTRKPSASSITHNSMQMVRPQPVTKTLGTAIDKATNSGLPILSMPFYRPFQYVGMTVSDAAKATGGKLNSGNNIVVDSEQAHMLLETEGNFVSYVDIELKHTTPCKRSATFDPEPLLGALSINPSELDFVHEQHHVYVYYDHKRRLKVSIACMYDGAPLSVGFGSKYYGM